MKATVGSVVLAFCSLSALGATRALAQAAPKFGEPQLEQLVAPIALYPDALLAQVLMSSTYPYEIFEAQRWVRQNSGLTGAALESALTQHDWEPSVKAMCGFPSVLERMNGNLDWTKDLGDAFLAQKAGVLATVQSMRHKALQSGSLKTTEQQTVAEEDSMIAITSAGPDVICVPTYSPLFVYGAAWHYPTYDYPALYGAPVAGEEAIAFTTGVAWGAAMYGSCDWHQGDVIVDVDRYNAFDKSTAHSANVQYAAGQQAAWHHDPVHRRRVNYGDAESARKYGWAQAVNDYARGRARAYGDQAAARGYADSGGAFSGSSSGSLDRDASERGAASWRGRDRPR